MESKTSVVAVAGGTGFVGSAIARELAMRGHKAIVLSHRGTAADSIAAIDYRPADVTRPVSLVTALVGVDTLVISLGFRNSPVEAPRRGQTFDEVDAEGTKALVAAAVQSGVRRLVYMSGAGAAPDAARHWFKAKWRAEESVRQSGIVFTIFRPSWIYGPGDKSLNRFLGFARWLPFIPQIGNGRQLLVPVLVSDMAALVADSLETPAAENVTFEVGGPETLTMDEIVRAALTASGRRRPILHAPAVLMRLVTRPLTLLPTPPMTPDAIDFIVASAPVDTDLLRQRFPRRLMPLAEGLATYLSPRR